LVCGIVVAGPAAGCSSVDPCQCCRDQDVAGEQVSQSKCKRLELTKIIRISQAFIKACRPDCLMGCFGHLMGHVHSNVLGTLIMGPIRIITGEKVCAVRLQRRSSEQKLQSCCVASSLPYVEGTVKKPLRGEVATWLQTGLSTCGLHGCH
jgi:hypothetical protein